MIIKIYSTNFRNWEFISDELNSNNNLLDVSKSFISYPNYYEFVDRIQFHSINDKSLYNDSTNNQFKSDILWLDALLSPGMEALLYVFTKRLSLVIKYIVNRNNVDKEVQMNDVWHITLLDKKQIYRNKEAFPNFDYKTKEVSKRVGKVIKINDNKFEKFRNKHYKLLEIIEEFYISNKDFRVYCHNRILKFK